MLMNDDARHSMPGTKAGVGTVGLGVLAIVCCVSGPLIAGALGSGALVGVGVGAGVGVLAVVVAGTVIVLRFRRRRACESQGVESLEL